MTEHSCEKHPSITKRWHSGCGQAIAPSPLRVLMLQLFAGKYGICLSHLAKAIEKTNSWGFALSKAKAKQQLRDNKCYSPSLFCKEARGQELRHDSSHPSQGLGCPCLLLSAAGEVGRATP